MAFGTAPAGQIARWRHLRDRGFEVPATHDARFARAAEEAFLIAALDVFREMVRREMAAVWEERQGTLAHGVSFDTLLRFARWQLQMPAADREIYNQTMQACSEHGQRYKLHLPGNHTWLMRAAQEGIDVLDWLEEGAAFREIAGRRFELCFCVEPAEILKMGKYFGTCLSPGECNQFAVLANAHDANKQVVYIYERPADDVPRGRPVARVLLAINTDFELMHYEVYGPSRQELKPLQEQLQAAVLKYAAQRAQRAGL